MDGNNYSITYKIMGEYKLTEGITWMISKQRSWA